MNSSSWPQRSNYNLFIIHWITAQFNYANLMIFRISHYTNEELVVEIQFNWRQFYCRYLDNFSVRRCSFDDVLRRPDKTTIFLFLGFLWQKWQNGFYVSNISRIWNLRQDVTSLHDDDGVLLPLPIPASDIILDEHSLKVGYTSLSLKF